MKNIAEKIQVIETLLSEIKSEMHIPTENSGSIKTAALLEKLAAPTTKKALFAGGCFWGLEYFFRSYKGVIDVQTGYSGGDHSAPTYKLVHEIETGHREVVEVSYDSSVIDYETLVRNFFEIHDSSDTGGMRNERGFLYTSAIFYYDDEQKAIAQKVIKELEAKGDKVVTEVRPAGKVFLAENEHQNHHGRFGCAPVCHIYTERF